MKKRAMTLAALSSLAASAAWAQSNVTLYGIVDNGIGYQTSQTKLGSSSGGHSAVKMTHGVWASNRIGFKGDEDLGGGMKAVFQLESGFHGSTGAQLEQNAQFGRLAFIGMTHPQFGTLTAGRQYTAFYTLLAPYSPVTWLTGLYGAHPGDVDSLDGSYRANSSLVYMSPNVNGLQIGGSYAFGGQPGSVDRGSTWSAGVQYINGPFGIAAAFQRINNATSGGGAWDSSAMNGDTQPALSAINYGYRGAQAQQRVGVTGGWQLTPEFDISLSYANTQFVPGSQSGFSDEAIFNSAGVVLHWKPSPVWDLAAGYSHMRATRANGIDNAARYNQFNLSQYYSLSKRTGIYMVQAYQRASGNTFSVDNGAGQVSIVKSTASIGHGMNQAPSSSQSQFAAAMGIVHRF